MKSNLAIVKMLLVAVVSIFFLCPTSPAQLAGTNKNPARIDAYITPFYNSQGTDIDTGTFSTGLASTNEAYFVATIQEMKRRWAQLNFVEMYVGAIRLYDMGFRKESVYWFYSAEYRGRLFGSLLDEKKKGGLGAPGFELLQANSAFHQLVGPYINSYAGCDTDDWIQVIQRVKEECKAVPDMKSVFPKVVFVDPSKWPKQNEEIADGLSGLLKMVKEQASEIKEKRVESGVEAQFCKLTNKEFSNLSAKDSIETQRLLDHLKAMEEARNTDRMERDRQDLVRLGCFEHREFQLKSRLLTEKAAQVFSKMVSKAAFINDNWALMMEATNSKIITVTAHRADMPAWEKLVALFDSDKAK